MFFENVILGAMLAWALGGVLFSLPALRLRPLLGRANKFLCFATWTVFGCGREQSEISVYTFEYRDDGRDASGAWTTVVEGRPWRWHSFLWQPDRRMADRFHRIGQDIAQRLVRGEATSDWLGAQQTIIEGYLVRRHPAGEGVVREVRVRMRRSVIDETGMGAHGDDTRTAIEDRVLMVFRFSSGSRHEC